MHGFTVWFSTTSLWIQLHCMTHLELINALLVKFSRWKPCAFVAAPMAFFMYNLAKNPAAQWFDIERNVGVSIREGVWM